MKRFAEVIGIILIFCGLSYVVLNILTMTGLVTGFNPAVIGESLLLGSLGRFYASAREMVFGFLVVGAGLVMILAAKLVYRAEEIIALLADERG